MVEKFSLEEKRELKRYCQEIIDDPRPIESQLHHRKDNFLWCQDWELIEHLKYFFNGEPMYLSDPPPKRLKGNPLWSKEKIIKSAKKLMEAHNNASEIIQALKVRRL